MSKKEIAALFEQRKFAERALEVAAIAAGNGSGSIERVKQLDQEFMTADRKWRDAVAGEPKRMGPTDNYPD